MFLRGEKLSPIKFLFAAVAAPPVSHIFSPRENSAVRFWPWLRFVLTECSLVYFYVIALFCAAELAVKLLNDSIFVPPAAIYSLFHGFSSIRTAAGPTTWNLLQNNLREPDMQIDCFRRTLKTCLFDQYSAH